VLESMSSRQLTEWIAYAKLEPFGEERADLRAGIVASVIANANRDPKRKPYKPEDFMPRFEPRQAQTWQEQLAIMQAIATGKNK
jgi:hypothetical protein